MRQHPDIAGHNLGVGNLVAWGSQVSWTEDTFFLPATQPGRVNTRVAKSHKDVSRPKIELSCAPRVFPHKIGSDLEMESSQRSLPRSAPLDVTRLPSTESLRHDCTECGVLYAVAMCMHWSIVTTGKTQRVHAVHHPTSHKELPERVRKQQGRGVML